MNLRQVIRVHLRFVIDSGYRVCEFRINELKACETRVFRFKVCEFGFWGLGNVGIALVELDLRIIYS